MVRKKHDVLPNGRCRNCGYCTPLAGESNRFKAALTIAALVPLACGALLTYRINWTPKAGEVIGYIGYLTFIGAMQGAIKVTDLLAIMTKAGELWGAFWRRGKQ